MQAVLDNINKDTFGSYLDVASSHRLERLEAKCIDYLLANFNKVRISTLSSPGVKSTQLGLLSPQELCLQVRASICCSGLP